MPVIVGCTAESMFAAIERVRAAALGAAAMIAPPRAAPLAGDRWRLARLTVNYRTPAEIMAAAAPSWPRSTPGSSRRGPCARPGCRPGGWPPPATRSRPRSLRSLPQKPRAKGGSRSSCRTPAIAELGAAVSRAVPGVSFGRTPDLTSPVVLLGATQAKGLEFDSVLIADPAAILAGSPRGRNDLYVAMTRSTRRLGILHPDQPPAELATLPARRPARTQSTRHQPGIPPRNA
jgi:hypothetical protein